MNLLEISDNYRAVIRQLYEFAEEHEGDTTGFPLMDELAKLEGDLKTKVLNIACIIKEETAEGKAIKELGDSLVKRGQAKINAGLRLKEWLEMNLPDNAKFEDNRAAVAWQKNGGKEAVQLMPEVKPEDLPAEFQYQPPVEADTEAMREKAVDLGNGKRGIKDGEKLLAEVFRGKHVRIR